MEGVKARRAEQETQAAKTARASRKGRGMRRANTMHVYEVLSLLVGQKI